MIKNKYSVGDEVLIIPNYRDDNVCIYRDIIDEIIVNKEGVKYSTSRFYSPHNEDELLLVKECTPEILYDIVFSHLEDINNEEEQNEQI